MITIRNAHMFANILACMQERESEPEPQNQAYRRLKLTRSPLALVWPEPGISTTRALCTCLGLFASVQKLPLWRGGLAKCCEL